MSEDEASLTWPALRRYFPGLKIERYLRPLPERGVIYVKNPKAACSTLMSWLDRIHTGELDANLRNIHKEHRLPRVSDVGRSQVIEMLSGAAYRFSFVRNPLRRLESSYWDKIVQWRERERPDIPASLGLSTEGDTIATFEEFLGSVEQQDAVREMNPHWRAQHVNLLHPLVAYDHIGRLESFDTDLERIRKEAGLPEVPLQARNTSTRDSGSVYDGRPDLVRRVEQLYATDFELYGY